MRLSQSGDLLLLPTTYRATRVTAVSRAGAVTVLPFPLARYLNPRVSPDGRRVMVESQSLRLDALDLERQTISRLTPEVPGTICSLWNSDGTAIVFKRFNLPYWMATDGSGREGPVPGGVPNDFLSGPGPEPDSFLSARISPTKAADAWGDRPLGSGPAGVLCSGHQGLSGGSPAPSIGRGVHRTLAGP